jgi:hypothetical protein
MPIQDAHERGYDLLLIVDEYGLGELAGAVVVNFRCLPYAVCVPPLKL